MNVMESLEKCIVILGGVRPRVDQPDIFSAAKAVINEIAAVHDELSKNGYTPAKEDENDGAV